MAKIVAIIAIFLFPVTALAGSEFELATGSGTIRVRAFEDEAKFRLAGPGFRISVQLPSRPEPIVVEPVGGRIKIFMGEMTMSSTDFTLEENGQEVLNVTLGVSQRKTEPMEVPPAGEGVKPEPVE